MYGLPSRVKEALDGVIEDSFDRIALSFIGNIPKLRNAKRLVISGEQNFNLAHLFVQAMGNKMPNSLEQDVLKSLLNSAHGYIEALKNRTRATVTERIDGLARESQIKNQKMSEEDVQKVVQEELGKASSDMFAIVESESTKLRNLGTIMDISRVASSIGDSDPTVFFVIVRDGKTCPDCLRLHMMPDMITPRLWKLGQLRSGYGKRGDDAPSMINRHPHCRCSMAYLSKDWGFNELGRLEYKGAGHDAYLHQKE